ncbi:alpha/beta hydrolase [Alicyclobacillus cycloheptanicus]|nr:alpha/beta hydrolase [Alicyclobacillus cycloheptanicus]
MKRPFVLAGWSMGGGIAMQYSILHPTNVSGLILISPLPPYGFGGTRDADGTPCWPDFAGSGGGTVNPEFIARIQQQDRSSDDANSPRNVMNQFYFLPPFRVSPDVEEMFVDSMLSTKIGDGFYPGGSIPSPNWPGTAPGLDGVANAMSPKYVNLSGLAQVYPHFPVLWIRGDADQIVSDQSIFDLGTLGKLGLVPGWPGEEVYPPQPMVTQMRTVL